MNLNPQTGTAVRLLHEGTLAFARAEQQGIRVDIDYIKSKKRRLNQKIASMEKQLEGSKFYRDWKRSVKGSVNIYSNPQLSTYLYKVKKIKPKKLTKSGQGSTDEEALNELGIPEINKLLRIRKLKKIRDTYLEAFNREQVDGYLHPSFNLHLVRTYRSSSDKPNFQNIPNRDKEAMKLTRNALYPRPGHQLVGFDFSGLEVRIAACYHQDPTMLKYIKDPTSDMHADMAAQLFMIKNFDKNLEQHYHLRQAAKNGFVFPEFYGDYFGNCAEALACTWGQLSHGKWKEDMGVDTPDGKLGYHMLQNGINSLKSFKGHVKDIEEDFWENRFSDYAKWKERWWKDYQKRGYIDMKTGFRCSGVMGRNDCINYPVQGAAFHCLLWSFIELDKIMVKEQWKTRLISQTHDDILFDAHPDELDMVLRVAKRVTCVDLPNAWRWINVPLEIEAEICDVDASLANKKKIEIP